MKLDKRIKVGTRVQNLYTKTILTVTRINRFRQTVEFFYVKDGISRASTWEFSAVNDPKRMKIVSYRSSLMTFKRAST